MQKPGGRWVAASKAEHSRGSRTRAAPRELESSFRSKLLGDLRLRVAGFGV